MCRRGSCLHSRRRSASKSIPSLHREGAAKSGRRNPPTMNPKRVAQVLATLLFTMPVHAASYYPLRLDDPKAVYLARHDFPVRADGVADDADALQQAINRL